MADDATQSGDNAANSEAQAIQKRWLLEIEAAEKKFEDYWRRCGNIVDIYREQNAERSKKRKFALLWSNVETLKTAIYSRVPEPVVKRRFDDQAPIARNASDVIERALKYNFEKTGFDGRMREVRNSYLLVARGTAWVRYEPTIGTKQVEGQEPYEYLKSERTVMDFVHWKDFVYPQQRTWADVPWVCRKVYMGREGLVDRFGKELGEKIPLDHKPDGASDSDDKKFWKATIYEIWSKVDGKCYWISKQHQEALDWGDPPLELEGFFPCPEPVFGTLSGEDLIPTPDYIYYQDQANEINRLTERINALTDMLKLVGFYPAESSENAAPIETAIKAGVENKVIGVPSWAAFADRGGSKQIEWLPIEQVARIIKECVALRKELQSDVYQITGISDIVRGESDARETATAQGIKAQWGSMRIRDRQADMARFARDITRLMGEVIADKFQPETLVEMTGIQLPRREEVQAQYAQQIQEWQLAAAQSQQSQLMGHNGGPAMEVPPRPQPPQVVTLDDVMDLLRDDRMRSFQIDIETDSTIEADENEQKGRMVEYVKAFGEFVTTVMPVGEKVPELVPVFGEILTESARVFRVSRALETAIDNAMQKIAQRAAQPPVPPQPSPDEQMKLEVTKVKAGAEVNKANAENQRTAMELQADREKHAHQRISMLAEPMMAAPQTQVMQ